MDAAPFDRRRSREVGRRRLVDIRKRLLRACDADDLADLVLDRSSLSRIIGKMKRRRQIWETMIQMADFHGDVRKVWCLYKLYAPAHDNALTKIMKALCWPDEEKPTNIEPVGTGDQRVKPDAVTVFPKPRLWEMDMDTEKFEEIEKKVKALMTQPNAVLWVAPTEARRQKLIAWTKDIHDRSFFALWQDVIDNPQGKVWKTGGGAMVALSFVPKDVKTDVPKDVH